MLAANDAFLHMSKVQRGEIVGRSLSEILPHKESDCRAAEADVLRRSISRAIASGKPDSVLLRRHPLSAHAAEESQYDDARNLSVVNTPVFDAHGVLTCIAHTVSYVATAHLNQRELLANEARYREPVRGDQPGVLHYRGLVRRVW
ncbi:PAS domain-containing protein [Caballeronia pedi]|uniref:PAS domain-containing protein n=1 Tax=Caballeronia pedi TaxID=1777141 RepID=UPI000A6B1976|nr:PAS domain-containing protein [Caballeronia pedi]